MFPKQTREHGGWDGIRNRNTPTYAASLRGNIRGLLCLFLPIQAEARGAPLVKSYDVDAAAMFE